MNDISRGMIYRIYPEECTLLFTVDVVFLYLNRGWILFIQSLFHQDLISDFYLTSLQLVLCRVAAVKRLSEHQP